MTDDDALVGVADALTHWPDVLIRLYEEHRRGPDGRCLACTSQVRLAPHWPCALAVVAELGLASARAAAAKRRKRRPRRL